MKYIFRFIWACIICCFYPLIFLMYLLVQIMHIIWNFNFKYCDSFKELKEDCFTHFYEVGEDWHLDKRFNTFWDYVMNRYIIVDNRPRNEDGSIKVIER